MMLQDLLKPAGEDILSWVLCSWQVLNSGVFFISWESFRHLISWNILKMQIKMFFFFFDKMLYFSELFLYTCILMTYKHCFLGGLKAVVYILCLKLHTRPLLLVFFVAVHGFYFFVFCLHRRVLIWTIV